ncbi:hypothetical protein [Sphingorhabdus sp.]
MSREAKTPLVVARRPQDISTALDANENGTAFLCIAKRTPFRP